MDSGYQTIHFWIFIQIFLPKTANVLGRWLGHFAKCTQQAARMPLERKFSVLYNYFRFFPILLDFVTFLFSKNSNNFYCYIYSEAWRDLCVWLIEIMTQQIKDDQELYMQHYKAKQDADAKKQTVSDLENLLLEEKRKKPNKRTSRMVSIQDQISNLLEQIEELQATYENDEIDPEQAFYIAELPDLDVKPQHQSCIFSYITSTIDSDELDTLFLNTVNLGIPNTAPNREEQRVMTYIGKLLKLSNNWPWCDMRKNNMGCHRPNKSKKPDVQITMGTQTGAEDWEPPIVIIEVEGSKDVWGRASAYTKILEGALTSLTVYPRVYGLAIKHANIEIYCFERDPDRGMIKTQMISIRIGTTKNEGIGKALVKVIDKILLALTDCLQFTRFYRTAFDELTTKGYEGAISRQGRNTVCQNCWKIESVADVKTKMVQHRL